MRNDKNKTKKKYRKKEPAMTKINTKSILHLLTIVLGNSLCAFAIAAFVIPNGLIMGGATGVGLFFNHLFSIPTSAVVFLFNVSVLVLGWYSQRPAYRCSPD